MIPNYINDIGYFISAMAMTGALLVSMKRPLLAFWLWVITNAFEMYVSAYYYHNFWLASQMAFFEINAWLGIWMWRKKIND